MKTTLLKLLPALLLAALFTTPALAIKITVPKQYEDQVDAIKKAEAAERQRQLDGAEARASEDSGGLNFSVTDEAPGSNEADPTTGNKGDADEFLVQSLAEAANTANDLKQEAPANMGFISGQIVDKESGQPIPGVAILLEGTDIGTITDDEGRYTLGPAAAGQYTINFVKSGYIPANVADFAVAAGEVSVFPFALPPRPVEMSDEEYVLTDFSVTAEEANQMMVQLELRMDSDKMLNLFSAEDFSKFASSDVADALKRVAGVNIVEGQFAVIRGLEDRYSSTTYNGAPVPSPDPDSQSVQLDLFPSDVVTNLEIAKTFAGDLPSNSSGGNINIVTHDYPDAKLEIKAKAGTGFEDNAVDRFLNYKDGSPIGSEASTSDVIESDFSIFIGGRREYKEREIRFKALVGNEIDYSTKVGSFEQRSPAMPTVRRFPRPSRVIQPGDLSIGQLNLSDSGRWDRTESERSEQKTAYAGLGFDLDKEGKHRIDGSYFYTNKKEETVKLLENGFIPDRRGYSYFDAVNTASPIDFGTVTGTLVPSQGAPWIASPSDTYDPGRPTGRDSQLWFAPVFESSSFNKERELELFQLNGSHDFDLADAFNFSWAGNHAEVSQDEEVAGIKYFFEPDTIPNDATLLQWKNDKRLPSLGELGPGSYVATSDIQYVTTSIQEEQDFLRADASLEKTINSSLKLTLDAGLYFEQSERKVTSGFLENPRFGGSNEFNIIGGSPQDVGQQAISGLDRSGLDGQIIGFRNSNSDASREIKAFYLNGKKTWREKFDFLYGARFENIVLRSNNDPFFEIPGGRFNMFPNRVLLGLVTDSSDPLFNIDFNTTPTDFDAAQKKQISNIINSEIDEKKFLPTLGFAYRPIKGLSLRGAWSKTVARPSFREMGYYTTAAAGSSDLVIGNPLLSLSNVESYDLRAEYTWGTDGDLVAVSLFRKYIADPIEKFRVRDPVNKDELVVFQSFFNNPNEAELNGIEFEFRKSLAFWEDSLFKYFSVGGNATYIKAEVKRSQIETAGSEAFFGVPTGDPEAFSGIAPERRLFGQPEWILNLDVTFEQPDWGTKATLAWFGISDILDAAGSVSLDQRDLPTTMTPDRYVGSFQQFDLILTQKWNSWTFGFTVKNLTDSKRSIVYDPNQTSGTIEEQSFRVGRDYAISASYAW